MIIRILPKPWWVRVLLFGLMVVCLSYPFSRLASRWNHVSVHRIHVPERDENHLAQHARTHSAGHGEAIRIASYNIAHGRGLADSNWHGGNLQQRLKRLDAIGALLRDVDADLVILNEVDFDASWSFGVNQARHLAEIAHYPYCSNNGIMISTSCFGSGGLATRF
jgi:hypothetical protein